MSTKILKSFQSSLTLAGCIVIIFGTAGAMGNTANIESNQKSDFRFPNEQSFPDIPEEQTPTQSVFEPFLRNRTKKRARFLTSLFNSDTMKCAPQVMCELISANEPGPDTNTLNDYKYLVKEFLRRDSDEVDDKPTAKYRSNDSGEKSRKKIPKKSKTDSDSSSEEASVSLPSGEDKRTGLAQLMDLEEEEAIDNKAIDDMIADDPDDFVFALADTRKKQRMHELAVNRLNNVNQRFRRNVEILEKTLAENRRLNIFRTSRAIQNQILEKKAKELGQTKNMMDRLRIAAEVGSTTRSGRQCRALFDTSTCSVNTKGIQGLVENVRKTISGSGTNTANPNQNVGLTVQDVKTLIKEAQTQPANYENVVAKSNPDVKVVLNIGAPSPQQMQEAAMLSGGGYQPMNQPMMYWPQLPPMPTVPTTASTTPLSISLPKIPPKTAKHTSNISNDKKRHSSWPKLKVGPNKTTAATKINQVVEKSEDSLKDKELRDQYKVKLQQAANILRLPWGLPKNFTTTKQKTKLQQTSHKKAKSQSKFPTPKKNKLAKLGNSLESSDSDSFESSEEDGEELGNVDVLQNNYLTSPWTTGPLLPVNQNFYRGLHHSRETPAEVIASVPTFASQRHNNFRQRATGSSLVSNVYDIFFKKVLPLPHHSSEWIPSALRHGRRNQVRRNDIYQGFGDSSSPPHSRKKQFPHPHRLEYAWPKIPRQIVKPNSNNNSPPYKSSPYQTKPKKFLRKKRRKTLKYKN